MPAAATDYFSKAYQRLTTTLSADKAIAASSMTLNSATNWPTDTGVKASVYNLDANGDIDTATLCVYRGTVSGSNITNLTLVEGTDQLHSSGATVSLLFTATHWNDAMTGMAVDHDQAGRHKNLTDANGNEWIKQTATASAVNEFTISNAATGNRPTLEATGDDTNIGLGLKTKGTGSIVFQGNHTGWIQDVLPAVSTVTYNGNRSYTLDFASAISSLLTIHSRVRATRTVTAQAQCADLESGSTQYGTKSTPTGVASFTDDFTVMGWAKLESYASMVMLGRLDAASNNGWACFLNASGQVVIIGYNTAAANYRSWTSYQSVPLGKWVHIAAQLDMNGYTSATCKIYFDGVEVPGYGTSAGTNPTALTQPAAATAIQLGATNGNLWDGKLCQVGLFSSLLSAATIRQYSTYKLTGAESTCIGYWALDGGFTDSSSNANNLTAMGGAVATNADTPFGQNSNQVSTGTQEYGMVTSIPSSTSAVIQCPEGCVIPTSSGVSAMAYSTAGAAANFPLDKGRWTVESLIRAQLQAGAFATGTTVNHISTSAACLTVPVGSFAQVGYEGSLQFNISVAGSLFAIYAMSETTASVADTTRAIRPSSASATEASAIVRREAPYTATAQTPFYFNVNNQTGVNLTSYIQGGAAQMRFFAIPSGI